MHFAIKIQPIMSLSCLSEFRESFNLFDKENDNRIHVKDLGTVLRSLGLHPTEAECTDLLSTIETEGM